MRAIGDVLPEGFNGGVAEPHLMFFIPFYLYLFLFASAAGCSTIYRASQQGEIPFPIGYFLQINCTTMIAHSILELL
jgi:hypothetical protein